MNDIQALLSKYKEKENELEKKLADIKDKLAALTKVVKILDEEMVTTKMTASLPLPIATNNKYVKMSMPDSILDLLSNHGELTGKEIKNELLRNGFKSASKTLQGDIYGRLNQLARASKIVVIKDGTELARYKIATSPSYKLEK